MKPTLVILKQQDFGPYSVSSQIQRIKRILDFYRSNSHKYNRVRDPMQMLRSAQKGHLFTVENPGGDFMACAGCFESFNMHSEFGATRVIMNGFGIQKWLHWARILARASFEDQNGEFYSVIASDNRRSIQNTIDSGFSPWDPDQEFLKQIQKFHQEEIEGRLFFRIERKDIGKALQGAAAKLLELHGSVVKRKDGRAVQVMIDMPMISDPDLVVLTRDIAAGVLAFR